MLLVAVGADELQYVGTTTCWAGLEDSRLALLAIALDISGEQGRAQLDGCKKTSCLDAHLGPLTGLDIEVTELVCLISPALQAKCPRECRVLLACKQIKMRFPERFV